MKSISLSCVAILTGVMAFSFAAPAANASSGDSPACAARAGELSREGESAATVVFRAGDGISLGDPTKSDRSGEVHFECLSDAGDKAAGYRLTWNADYRHPAYPGAEVSWPVLQGRKGVATGYTVTSRLTSPENGRPATSECWVADQHGVHATQFHCEMVQRGRDAYWQMRISDDVVNRDRIAESSGSIKTEGSVNLAAGGYASDAELQVQGAAVVPVGKSTQFDAVLRPGDKAANANTARMAFIYEILDGGQPALSKTGQPLQVVGNVSNHRGLDEFEGKSSCRIVTRDRGFEDHDSNYSCVMDSYYDGSVLTEGRARYITDFTISRKR